MKYIAYRAIGTHVRRADRLFQIVQILRNRRSVTARDLAEKLEVSERTIYRDMQDLSVSGVPIEGEAGVGYTLRHSLDIPPLMFSEDEIQAIVLGARMVQSWGGKELSTAAKRAIDKVEGALPSSLKHFATASHLYAFPFDFVCDTLENIDVLRSAINAREKISFQYTRIDSEKSERIVQPLALYFWGKVWTLTAWCELRDDFRNFRIDNICSVTTTGEKFDDIHGKNLEAYIAKMKAGHDC